MQHVTNEGFQDFHGPWQQDHGVMARFFTKDCENPRFGKDAGAPRYINVPYVEKVPNGDYHRSRVVSKASDLDKERFRDAWTAFERGARGGEVGTPLKEWPYLTTPMVRELQDNQVLTVDKLASLPEKTALGILGPDFRTIQAKARAFLVGNENEAQKQLGNELRAANQRIQQLESQMLQMRSLPPDEKPGDGGLDDRISAMLEAKLAALVPAAEAAKRGPGRPRKEEAA